MVTQLATSPNFTTVFVNSDYTLRQATWQDTVQGARRSPELSLRKSASRWYNQEHRHTGLGLMTPATVHYDQAEGVQEQRQRILDAAYMDRPERFVGGRPTPPELPEEVWINQPKKIHDHVPCSDGPTVGRR